MHAHTLSSLPLETLRDTLPLIPILFVLYAVLEYASHREGFQLLARSRERGRLGPVAGAVLGLIPQCGMSVFVTSLFVSGRVTIGTLVATYLATSDEALPVLIAHGQQGSAVAAIVVIKFVLGVGTGIVLDLIWPVPPYAERAAASRLRLVQHTEGELQKTDWGRILGHSLRRTLEIVAWVFLVGLAIGGALTAIGPDRVVGALRGHPAGEVFASGLFGLIPNCAASIAIAEGLIHRVLSFGAVLAGLSAGAGYGPIVLLRERQFRSAGTVLLICFAVAVVAGLTVNATGPWEPAP
jgi:hypothetical protein